VRGTDPAGTIEAPLGATMLPLAYWGLRFGVLRLGIGPERRKVRCHRRRGRDGPSKKTGCEEKVMVRVHHCSSGIHAQPSHLEGGDFAGTVCGGQLAPARR